jgi:hypothetical protein
MAITRLIYFSENQLNPLDGPVVRQLGNILKTANGHNKAVGLTGALVFDDLWFLQVLEGDRAAVWTTFKRIEADERHSHVVVVEVKDVPGRIFGNWWMGLIQRGKDNEETFSPYLRDGKLRPSEMTADQILALMTTLANRGLSREMASLLGPV